MENVRCKLFLTHARFSIGFQKSVLNFIQTFIFLRSLTERVQGQVHPAVKWSFSVPTPHSSGSAVKSKTATDRLTVSGAELAGECLNDRSWDEMRSRFSRILESEAGTTFTEMSPPSGWMTLWAKGIRDLIVKLKERIVYI
jgi:hypothetical protein